MEKTVFNTPFVKKFKTPDNRYLYDVNSNRLVRVDAITHDLIEEIDQLNLEQIVQKFAHLYSPKFIRKTYNKLLRLKVESNLFSSRRPKITSGFRSEADVKVVYNPDLRQLILQVSQDCNQRCRYCPFSGTYPLERTHNASAMSWEIAQKTLDFFITHSSDTLKNGIVPAVTFYGGEPLLNFGLIRQVIEYIKTKGVFNRFRFSFTTNGTLLKEDAIKFLVENKITILVSLDGPKKLNDRYRVFVNGRGTFDPLFKNLKKLKRYNREYFENHVFFNVGIVPPTDFPAIKKFFYRSKFFEPFRDKIMFFFVNANENTFFQDYHLEGQKEKVNEQLSRLERRYSKALIEDKYEELTIEKGLFLKAFHAIACRPIEPLRHICSPRGTCIPGLRRLFVDITGAFYMCERVGSHYPIGHVDTGFDYRRILEFYKEYDGFFFDCSDCWAVRLCTKCFNNIRKGGNFDHERKAAFCRKKLRSLEQNLVNYCRVIEKRSDAFKFMETIEIT